MIQSINDSTEPLRKIHQVFERLKSGAGVNDFCGLGDSLDKASSLSCHHETCRSVGEHHIAVWTALAFEDASQQPRVGLRVPATKLLERSPRQTEFFRCHLACPNGAALVP